MSRRPDPPDKKALLDLWKASKPRVGEQMFAFTIKFSTDESNRLKKQRNRYIIEAHRTIRDLFLRVEKTTAMVVIVERNRSLTDSPKGPTTDLHAHGWVRVTKNNTAESLQDKLCKAATAYKVVANKTVKKKQVGKQEIGIKVVGSSGIYIQDTYFSEQEQKVKPLDIGWARYISKHFGRTPTGCKRPMHFFSASKSTKTHARAIRNQRLTTRRNLLRVFRREERMIMRNEGEWKYFAKAHACTDANMSDEYDDESGQK